MPNGKGFSPYRGARSNDPMSLGNLHKPQDGGMAMNGSQRPRPETRTNGRARRFTETELRELAARGASELPDAGATELWVY